MIIKDLLAALEGTKAGLAKNALVLAQAENYVLTPGYVTTYNDLITVRQPVADLDVTCLIPPKEISKILKRLKGDKVSFEINDGELRLRGGKTRAGISVQTDIQLPLQVWDELEDAEWVALPDNFLDQLKLCIPVCSTDMVHALLTNVCLTSTYMEACDNVRLIRANIDLPIDEDKQVLLPQKAAQEVSRLPVTEMFVTDEWVCFRTDDGVQINCHRMEGTYPDASALLSAEGTTINFPTDIAGVIRRIESIGEMEPMEVSVTKKRIELKRETLGSWIAESEAIEYTDKPLRFKVNPNLLNATTRKETTCTVGKNRMVFSNDDWTYVVSLFITK